MSKLLIRILQPHETVGFCPNCDMSFDDAARNDWQCHCYKQSPLRRALASVFARQLRTLANEPPKWGKPTPIRDEDIEMSYPTINAPISSSDAFLQAIGLCPTCESPANAAAACEHAECPFNVKEQL